MSTPIDVIHALAAVLALGAMFVSTWRMRRGPSLLDRLVANDVLTAGAVACVSVLVVWWQRDDLAVLLILLALTGFVSAAIGSRFVTRDVVGGVRILTNQEAEEQVKQREEEALADELDEAEEAFLHPEEFRDERHGGSS